MATVDKDFRVKHGLVVEGTTATVNGEDILTTGSTISTSDLTEGTNLFFTDQRAVDAVADEIDTAVTTAIDALDTDDIEEGATNLYYTTARAKGDAADLLTNATLTNITITGNEDGLTITAENGVADSDTDDLTEGTTNLYFTNQRALDATASAYDATGTAQGIVDGLDTDDIEEGATNQYFTSQRALDATASAYDAAGAAATAQGNAEDYADGLAANYEVAGAAAAAQSAAESYADSAVSALVNGAPELLDTLNELAAAINDDASFASTIATQIGEKQNTLTAGSNIDITADTISVTGLDAADISDFDTAALSATASAYDASGAAATAESNANTYTDTALEDYTPTSGLDAAVDGYGYLKAEDLDVSGDIQTAIDELTTTDIEEGTNLYFTDTRAVDAIEAVVPNFTAVEVNSVAKQVAVTQAVATVSTVTGLSWAKADYKSAKLVVKAKTASHSQVSEIMVTLDAADNVAITEFGIVYSDEELATVTADVSGTDVRIRVTTLNASTDVTVVGMLLV
jgi:hypothetical protein